MDDIDNEAAGQEGLARRDFLKRMAAFAFAVPVVSSFALDAIAAAEQAHVHLRPNQYHPNQYAANQYHPNQYVANQYHPNQFHPNQFSANQYHPNQFHPNQVPPKRFVPPPRRRRRRHI